MLLFVDKAHEKTSQKVKKDVRAKCTCSLHLCYNFALCYMRRHSFSVNQKGVISSCLLLSFK